MLHCAQQRLIKSLDAQRFIWSNFRTVDAHDWIGFKKAENNSQDQTPNLRSETVTHCMVEGMMDSRWISGGTVDFWIQDGFLDCRWISVFAMILLTHDRFLHPRLFFGSTMRFLIRGRFLDSR